MKKNILKLSFEDSTKIVQSSLWVEDWTFHEKRKITSFNSNSGFFTRIMLLLVFGGFSLAAFFMGILYNIKDPTKLVEQNLQANELAIKVSFWLLPLLVLFLLIIAIFGLILLFPPKNFAWYRLIGYGYLTNLLLIILTGITPLGTALTYNDWGPIPTYLTFLFVPIFFIANLYDLYSDKKAKLNNGKSNLKKIEPYKIAIAFYLVCLILSLPTNFFNIEKLFKGSWLLIAYIALICGIRLMINSILTFHYILKYSKQYRVFYKIPDAAWWLSTRRANKHEHVYPVPEKANGAINE